jgi:outer membrane protein TolC
MSRRLAGALALWAMGSSVYAQHGALPVAGEQLYALPAEPQVRTVLRALPQLRESGLHGELAVSERNLLEAGPGEWVVRAGVARRTADGQRYREQEAAIERTVRWFGKAAQDRAIGDKGLDVAEAQRADAWHEAGRALMRDWYGALRGEATVRRLAEQHALVEQLQEIAAKRVKAGDAPALELLQAQTEVLRSRAAVEQADKELAQALQLLATMYPGLPAPRADQLPEPKAAPAAVAADVTRLMDDNHELELAQAQAQWQQLKARRADSDRMPDPTLGVRMSRERDGQERLLGFSVSMPLPGAARSADAASAVVRARMADEHVAQVRRQVELDARRTVADQRQSYQIWRSLGQVAAHSRRQADLMERAYQAGESTLSEALLSRRQAHDATLAAQTAQISALAAAARTELDAHALWVAD